MQKVGRQGRCVSGHSDGEGGKIPRILSYVLGMEMCKVRRVVGFVS